MRDLTSLDQAVTRHAARWPGKVFLRDVSAEGVDAVYTYAEADRTIGHLAAKLARLKTPNVGVMLTTSYRCICLVYAVMRAGKNVVLIDPAWGQAAQSAIVAALGLTAVVGAEPPSGPCATLHVPLDLAASEAPDPASPSAGAGTHLLLFTSGTTGKAKGICLTQEGLIAAYRLGQRCLGTGRHTNAGCFYRMSGLGILGIHCLFPVLFGGSITLLPEYLYASPHRFWEAVARYEITFLYIVPPIVSFLVNEGEPLAAPLTLGDVLCVSGSARLCAAIQDRFQESFAPLANIYGLSECGFAFLFGRRAGDRFDNSVGVPVGIETRLLDAAGQTIDEPGRRGRLHVKTPGLFAGYVNNPELTAELVVNGWLDTRDVAWFDAQGGVHVIGREDGTIKKAGNLFHLSECEELLSALPQVVEACCLKIASDLEGEDYVAFVKERGPRGGFDYAAHLATALGIARAPARIVVSADELPRNSAGKYDRRALLATLTR